MRAVKIPFAEEETEVRKSSDSSKFTKLRRLAAGQARGQKRECRWSLGARRVGSSVRSRAQGPRRGGGQPTGEVSVSRSISVRGERATAVRAAPTPAGMPGEDGTGRGWRSPRLPSGAGWEPSAPAEPEQEPEPRPRFPGARAEPVGGAQPGPECGRVILARLPGRPRPAGLPARRPRGAQVGGRWGAGRNSGG